MGRVEELQHVLRRSNTARAKEERKLSFLRQQLGQDTLDRWLAEVLCYLQDINLLIRAGAWPRERTGRPGRSCSHRAPGGGAGRDGERGGGGPATVRLNPPALRIHRAKPERHRGLAF